MLWLTWRQHRSQALITVGLLLALGVFLLIHGLKNADLVARFGSDRDLLLELVGDRYSTVANTIGWMPLVAVAVGLFWGAPVLGKEFERGTHRLVWTQSVSVRRWLAVKLGVLAAAVVLAGLAFGAMINAWQSSFAGTDIASRFGDLGMFVITGVVPAAWWLFAFVTGVAAGAVFRRTLPAIAVTVAVLLAAIMSLFIFGVRGHYATPERAVMVDAPGSPPPLHDAMIVRTELLHPDGRVFDARVDCPPAGGVCGMPRGTSQVFYYHPASRYWRFQWTEAGILLAASLALGVVAVNRTARSRI